MAFIDFGFKSYSGQIIITVHMIDVYILERAHLLMKTLIAAQLAAFNQLCKEMDEICHSYAKEQGISDTVAARPYRHLAQFCRHVHPRRPPVCHDPFPAAAGAFAEGWSRRPYRVN